MNKRIENKILKLIECLKTDVSKTIDDLASLKKIFTKLDMKEPSNREFMEAYNQMLYNMIESCQKNIYGYNEKQFNYAT